MTGIVITAQTPNSLSNFKTIKEIESKMPISHGTSDVDSKVSDEIYALFHKDPAMFLFKGDELDKHQYVNSQKYLKDKETLNAKKEGPLCLEVHLDTGADPLGYGKHQYDSIGKFTPNGYTIFLDQTHRWKGWSYRGEFQQKKFIKLGGIWFPTKIASRTDDMPEKDKYPKQYQLRITCSDTNKLLSIRSKRKEPKNRKDNLFSIAIIYKPGTVKQVSGKKQPYYFGQVIKAYLTYDGNIIDDITSVFDTYSENSIAAALGTQRKSSSKKTTTSRKTTTKKRR